MKNVLSIEEAMSILDEKDGMVHVLTFPDLSYIVGSDWKIETVRVFLAASPSIMFTGPTARRMRHGIAACSPDFSESYVFATNPEKIDAMDPLGAK